MNRTQLVKVQPEIILMFFISSSVPEATLQRHLFQSYYVEARPVFDPSQAVNVAIQFAINHIVDFDEDTHVVTVVGFLTLVGIMYYEYECFYVR